MTKTTPEMTVKKVSIPSDSMSPTGRKSIGGKLTIKGGADLGQRRPGQKCAGSSKDRNDWK